tara:strand:+ start:3952 stop:4095 length:144 start_codon:yes stop_codon:yes gene_type:complete
LEELVRRGGLKNLVTLSEVEGLEDRRVIGFENWKIEKLLWHHSLIVE